VNLLLSPAKRLRGEVELPGDKSITHRAMMIASISEGVSEVVGFSRAADPLSTLACLRALGVESEFRGKSLLIHGRGFKNFIKPRETLDAGNSGTTIRLLVGILAGQSFPSTITGDESLRRRPMKRVIDPLTQMGVKIESASGYRPPLHIRPAGGLRGIDYEMLIPSAQVKSSILLAGLHAEGRTRVYEPLPTRDHTERMLGLLVRRSNGAQVIEVEGGRTLVGRRFFVPGDVSAATFLIVAACIIPGSELVLEGIGLNPTRTAVIDVLRKMGADIAVEEERSPWTEPYGNVTVKPSSLRNVQIEPSLIPSLIDEIPALTIAGAVAKGRFEIRGASELRVKESDRVKSLCQNLRQLGVGVEEYEDGFAFEGENQLIPTVPLESYGDHRIGMAMGVAALIAGKKAEIVGAECVDISFPGFWNLLKTLTS
jgi:3-phosphoshikimate 1-carboxyvinyltransferase